MARSSAAGPEQDGAAAAAAAAPYLAAERHMGSPSARCDGPYQLVVGRDAGCYLGTAVSRLAVVYGTRAST